MSLMLMQVMRVASFSTFPEWSGRLRQSLSNGNWVEAFSHFIAMKRSGVELTDPSLFPAVLKACSSISFAHGACVHACSVKQGFEHFTSVGNSTVNLYVKWGFIDGAASVFKGMRSRDSVSWNTIAHGYLDGGDYEQGLRCFMEGRVAGFEPNVATLVLLVQACRSVGLLYQGQELHGYLMRSGFWGVVSVQNVMLGLYCECDQDLVGARKVFDEMLQRDVISWSMMIGGLLEWEEPRSALGVLSDMVTEGCVEPDGLTLVSALKACSAVRNIGMGSSIHGIVLSRGLDDDVFVGNSLIDMYSKCGDTNSASRVWKEMPLKNQVSWNSVISGLVHNHMHSEAVEMLESMRMAGVEEDGVTLACLVQMCKDTLEGQQCKLIHSRMLRRGYETNQVLGNCVMDAYAKCNLIGLCEKVFKQLERKNEVSWGTMIAGYGHCGMPEEAMDTYREMIESGGSPNEVISVNLVEASGSTAEAARVKWAHGIVTRRGLSSEVGVGTRIVEMYSKCGEVEKARRAFEGIGEKNVVSWSVLIGGYGRNGKGKEALELVTEMIREGVKPNKVTALSVLAACSHGGLVGQGLDFFKDMAKLYGIKPQGEHFACLVDLLSRAGRIEEACWVTQEFAAGGGGGSLWGALLSGCRRMGNTEIGQGVADRVIQLEPGSSGGYLLATGMHAIGGEWDQVRRLRRMLRDRGVEVLPGFSMLYLHGRGFKFVAGYTHRFPQCCQLIQGLHSLMASQQHNYNYNKLLDLGLDLD